MVNNPHTQAGGRSDGQPDGQHDFGLEFHCGVFPKLAVELLRHSQTDWRWFSVWCLTRGGAEGPSSARNEQIIFMP
jgi:hypothetical protein